MGAVWWGSFSREAPLGGVPVLSGLKLMTGYAGLAPPPRNRDEIRPSLLRPPERFLPSTSDFSGRSRVISSRETEVVKRRVGVVGLYFFIGMVKCSPLNLGVFRHLLAGLQRDVRFLPIRTITGGSP